MAVLKFLSVAAAAIFLCETTWIYGNTEYVVSPKVDADGAGEGNLDNIPSSPDGVGAGGGDVVNKAEREECWKQMNEARSLVGFAELTQENKFKIVADDWKEARGATQQLTAYLKTVCDAVKTNTAPIDLEPKIDGTFAYSVQNGETADCEAAVDSWKAAFTNFNGERPPAYKADTMPYNDTQNVSFISLFNPQATHVDCTYFTCPAAKQTDLNQRNTATEEEKRALICVTTPNVLIDGNEPYKQEQWDKITAGLNPSSAAAAAPAALAVAATAFAALLL
ncbi:SAG family member [Eimeria brunetti]|uniref:SAG family member n=1 Tax=Eimeria brunetti TaxID=51314 RepID=U6LUC8_9EIME|nr:SAG family member [Eimeria brunetti]